MNLLIDPPAEVQGVTHLRRSRKFAPGM